MNADLIAVILFYGLLLLFFFTHRKKFEVQGKVFAIYRTKLGLKLMDRIAKFAPKVLNFISYISIAVGFIGMFLILYVLLKGTYQLLVVPNATPVLAPVLPGVKVGGLPVLSFSYWIIAIFLVAVVHEFTHGIFARLYNIKIKSSGFAFLGPILGAFVEPDEKEMTKISNRKQLAILSGGPFANIVFAAVILIISSFFISPVVANVMQYNGVQVYDTVQSYPIDNAGIKSGDLILGINNISISNVTDFINALNDLKPNQKISILTNRSTYNVVSVADPDNSSRGYLGLSITPYESSIREDIKASYGTFLPDSLLWISKLFFWLFVINLGVGLFNLLPLGPIDGGRILLAGIGLFTKDKKLANKIWTLISTLCLLLILINIFPYIIKLFAFLFSFL